MQDDSGSIVNFPFLTFKEFENACQDLVDKWNDALARSNNLNDWTDVKLREKDGCRFVAITRRTKRRSSLKRFDSRNEESELELELGEVSSHDDKESMPLPTESKSLDLVYHVVYSSTYQVPVLYLLPFHTYQSNIKTALEDLYEDVIPVSLEHDVRNSGVMGGITMTNHPVLDCVCWFVHPCRTADALKEVCNDSSSLDHWKYFLLWFGIIGVSIGLSVPVALVEQVPKA